MKKKVINHNTKTVRLTALKLIINEWGILAILLFVITINISQFAYQNYLQREIEYFEEVNSKEVQLIEASTELQEERKNQLKITSAQIEELLKLDFNYTTIEISHNIFAIELQSESIKELEEIVVALENMGTVFLNNSDFINGKYYWSLEVKI